MQAGMSVSTPSPLIGNRYHLLDPIGRGAMGRVYRALDRLTGDTVALKRMTPTGPRELDGLASLGDDARLALAQEFRTLASLRHPHIISVLDYGFDAQRQPYFTMDLLADARTLLEAGQGQPLATQAALLIQVLQALAYLHRRGILHRDLKPSNVLVTAQGQVKLLDFGLADVLAGTQGAAGTLAYMAPEVLRGQPASQAADLYAVGVMAYQLLVGRHPFDTRHPTRLMAGILQAAPDLSPVADPRLAAVLSRWLAKDPGQRYTGADEAIAALSQAADQPIPEESRALRESFLGAAAFVGRKAEMAQLTAALQQAAEGRGSAWLVGGEVGVGKSRLLDELRAQALVAGATVVRGQAVQGAAPYQLWQEPLRRLALIAPPDDPTAAVVKPLAPDLPQLLGRDIPDTPELEGEAGRQRLHLALAELCASAARACSPLVLLLEDLQWANADLEPLRLLGRSLADLPLLLVGAYRSEERPNLPAELPLMRLLPLGPLAPESTAELIASMLGAAAAQPQVLDRLVQETEGNPFFLVETVHVLAEEQGGLQAVGAAPLPATIAAGAVQQVIRRRLARVPASHRPLLELAALAGRDLDLEVLRAAAPALHLDAWLTDCANLALLELREGSWRFVHDKLRLGLVSALDDGERARLQRQVAEAYERVHGDDPAYAAALTAHWEAARAGEKTAHYARLAGEHAAALYADDDAVRFFSKALAYTPAGDASARFALLLAREQIYSRQGNREAQAADLAQLQALAETPAQRCAVALRLGAYHNALSEYERALAAAEEAQRWAAAGRDRAGQAEALIIAGEALMRQGLYDQATARFAQAAELAEAAAALVQLARARSGLGEVAQRRGDFRAARRHHEEALRLRQESDDRPGQARSLRRLGEIANAQGSYQAARSSYLAALALARQIGDRPLEAQLLLNLAELDWRQGAYPQAAAFLQQSLSLARRVGDRFTEAAALNGLGAVASRQGRYGEAIAHWEQSLAISAETGDRASVSRTLNNLGSAAWRQRRNDQAIGYYQQSLAIKQELGDRRGMASTWQNLGVIAQEQGRYDEAYDYLERGLALARAIGDRAAEAMALTNLGRVDWRRGRFESALSCHHQSLGMAQEIGDRDVEANALTNLGLAAESLGEYHQAQRYYEQSLDVRQETGDRSGEGIVLNHLGALALLRSDYVQAERYFRRALAIRQELGQAAYQVEDWAGLALAAARQGDREAAKGWVARCLLDWAADPEFEKADQPMRTLYFTWQACQALGLAQAQEVLAAAAQRLRRYLDRHPDQEAQALYLRQPYHRALWDAWLAKGDSSG